MHHFTRQLTRFLPAVLVVLASCASGPDAERQELERALSDSTTLANEIAAWRLGVRNNEVSAASTQTIESFRDRAENIFERVEDLSTDATRGRDLSGVQLALREIMNFEWDGFTEASTTGRSAMLDQFAQLATNLHRAVLDVNRQAPK